MSKFNAGDKIRFVGPAAAYRHDICLRAFMSTPTRATIMGFNYADAAIIVTFGTSDEEYLIHQTQITARFKKPREFWISIDKDGKATSVQEVVPGGYMAAYGGEKIIRTREVRK